MLRYLALFTTLMLLGFNALSDNEPPALAQIDAAIERASTEMDAADPTLEPLLNTYRETRSLLLKIQHWESEREAFSAARENAYKEAQDINAELEKSLDKEVESLDTSTPLPELEQIIQLGKSDLAVLQRRLSDVRSKKSSESDRPSSIRTRLAELGAALPDLEANLKLMNPSAGSLSIEQAEFWLAQVQVAENQAEKAALDEELLSQPMRLQRLDALQDKLALDISSLESRIRALEQRANELRQGEADRALADAETAKTEARGKHALVQALADKNAVLSASLAERNGVIEGLRQEEKDANTQAEQFETGLKVIERKLEILGMTKTVGKILREQAIRLPQTKIADRRLKEIGELITDSSMQQMDLQDKRRELGSIKAYVDKLLEGEDPETVEVIKDDLIELATNRRALVSGAIDIENTYARTLSELDYAVHRLVDSVDQYKVFISERLLWVRSGDPLSLSVITELPGQLKETFAPGRWKTLMQWELEFISESALLMILLLLTVTLSYLTPRLKKNILARGLSVGLVRSDSFSNTLTVLGLTLLLMLRWPLLTIILTVPLAFYEADSPLAVAFYFSLMRTSIYYLGLEFLRHLLMPGGIVEAHFRWPQERVSKLYKRVLRFEQTFLPAVFLGLLSFYLYPSEVGGPVGTLAAIALLLSMAHFFYRLPHFVQRKMDNIFPEVNAKQHLHNSWGKLARVTLAWAPIAMIVGILFGYTYTAVEFSTLLMQTVALLVGMLLLHELGTRWLRVTRRRLRYRMQEELAQAITDDEPVPDNETLENDPEFFNDEGTKFLNALLLIGSIFGLLAIWSGVLPALGILNSIEVWHTKDTVNGQELLLSTTLGDIFGAVIIGMLGWVVIRRLPHLLEILLRRKMDVGVGSAYAVATVTKYFLTAVVLVIVLSMLGGSWSQIQWAVAALSLGIGFGLQEIVANFFSGIIILFEQPIRVGDTVTVGNTSGVVTKIHLRATTIRDWERRELLVPNKEFVTGRLLNWSLTDPVTRLHIELGVAYGTDMDKAMAIVRRAAEQHPLILDDPAPFVTFEEFGDNSLNISLRCYLEELEKRLTTASAIRLEINRKLNEADICVSFPQRDVHLDTTGPLDIRLLDSEGLVRN